jgi:hypothetical protein
MLQARCFSCKKNQNIVDPKYVLNKINRPAVHGTCAKCGGKVYRILATADAPKEIREKMEKNKGTVIPRKRKSKKSKTSKKGGRSLSKSSRKRPRKSRGSRR